ncbi:hypothetical protein [Alcanivorax sp. IL2]|uniref:hypothetical protein n=1 Tax=Alcanivorax sp. IL2 TaxID=3396310 RepID=UPI0039C40473
MKYTKYFMTFFYVVSLVGIAIQSIPSLQHIFSEEVFEVKKLSSETVGFHLPPNTESDDFIMLEYDGKSYHGLFIEKFSLTNKSGKNIRSSDFESGIKLLIKNNKETNAVAIETIDAKGDRKKLYLGDSANEIIIFDPHLINDKETLYVNIVSSESPAMPEFEGRIAGIDDFVFISKMDFRHSFKSFIFVASLIIMTFSSFFMGISSAKTIRKFSMRFSYIILVGGMLGVLGGIAMYGGTFYDLFGVKNKDYYYLGALLCYLPYLIFKIYTSFRGEHAFFYWLFNGKNLDEEESIEARK